MDYVVGMDVGDGLADLPHDHLRRRLRQHKLLAHDPLEQLAPAYPQQQPAFAFPSRPQSFHCSLLHDEDDVVVGGREDVEEGDDARVVQLREDGYLTLHFAPVSQRPASLGSTEEERGGEPSSGAAPLHPLPRKLRPRLLRHHPVHAPELAPASTLFFFFQNQSQASI